MIAYGLALLCLATAPPKKDATTRWEKTIASMESRDQKKAPPMGAVHFCGSSSIVLWPLEKSFPGRKVVKRGFGGSQIADSTFFADRIITRWKPSAIVFYAGDNDLASGKTPERVLADFQAFAARVRKESSGTAIYFISVKPSLARWKLWPKVVKANALVKAECEKGSGLAFIDVGPAMLGEDGKPKKELLAKDGLHLSAKGYEVWTSLVEKALGEKGR